MKCLTYDLTWSHHEQDEEHSLGSNDYLLVGTGLGQLCAAAVACASSVVDLPDIAVEAVRLAFRTGSVVETFSVQNQRPGDQDNSWSIIVPIAFSEIQAELHKIQDSAVWFL